MDEKEKKPDEEKTEEGRTEPAENVQEAPENEPEGEKADEGENVPVEGEKPSEGAAEGTAEDVRPPELSEADKLREENFRLRTQLEAMKVGFVPDVIEDAVVLAENIVKHDGGDISEALKAVAKKYPDWKAESKDGKAGTRFGAAPQKNGAGSKTDDRIDRAFGLKKKG